MHFDKNMKYKNCPVYFDNCVSNIFPIFKTIFTHGHLII